MASPAPAGSTAPLAMDGTSASLDQLLVDLRSRTWGDPVATRRGLATLAAEVLGAESVCLWLLDRSGVLRPAIHHPLGGECGVPASEHDAGEPPDVAPLRAGGARTVERALGPATALDTGVWMQGAIAGVLSATRPAARAWTAEERAFLFGLADRFAIETVSDERRIAEHALVQRRQQMRDVERLLGMGSWQLDLEADGIVWSDEQLRIHGLDRASAPRTTDDFLALVHPDDRERIVHVMSHLVETGEPFVVEYRIVRPDGEVRLLQAPGQIVSGADGRPTRMIGTSLDITERRATELALRASEESYRAIFDSSNDAIFVHDLETGAILDANRRACDLSAVTLDELRHGGLGIIANGPAPFTADRAVAYLQRAATGEAVRFEWMTIHPKTSEELWVEVSLQRVTIRGVDRLLALVRDIRDRKRAELALVASEESYRAIFDSSNDAIFVHDLHTGAVLDANHRACDLYGASLDLLRRNAFAYIANGPEPFTPERALQYVARARAGETVRFEWMTLHPVTREETWVEVSLQRVTIRGQDRLLGLGRDIRERRRTELALKTSEQSYRTIFQHASDPMWLHDIDTAAFLEVNDAAVELLGYSAEEQKALGVEGTSDGREPYTAERGREYMERALAGEPQRFEWLSRHKDGTPVWEEVTLRRVSIRGADRILATARDIRDRKRAELALQASEESYRTIFHHASDAMWLHDVDTGAFLEVNNAAVEMYGFSAEEQKQLGVAGISDGRPPYTAEQGREYLLRAAAGEPQRFEWMGRHRDGHSVWGEVRLRRVTIAGVDRILATARDINARKVAEAELRRANEELERRVEVRTAELEASNSALAQEVFEHAQAKEALLQRSLEVEGIFQALPDLYFKIDADQTLLDYRAGSADALYLPPEMFLGKRLRDVMPPHICDRFDEAFANAPHDAVVSVEYVLQHDDAPRDYEARFVSIGDGTRITVVRDITERKDAERALREREEHFRRLIENTSDLVTFVDSDGTVRYQSPALRGLLGYEPGSRNGRDTFELVHPDDRAATEAVFADLVAHPGATRTAVYRLQHADGSWRVVESMARTIRPDSAAEGVVVNSRDITERTIAESALARAKEDAERANRAKSEFLSRMSHELRTPMNSILGFAQLLARAELSPQQLKSVQHILKAGRHLLHLINEVLEIARIEAGRENFSLEPVSLASVMQEAFGLVRPLAQQWEVELREGAWPREAYVLADRQRLVQVMLNLLSNAIKYNRPGGYVRLGCTPSDERWTVRVEDGGRGIPSERVGQLFTPFARLGAEQTEVEGTGLGLALSRRLCEAMSGSLVLEKSDTSGSVFTIELLAAEDPLRTLEETGAHAIVAAPHRTATLLYVEDNLANLSLVDTILLSRPGWRTIPALQGQIGVELAREHVPDLILLDLHLPDISGEEVLRRLRGDTRTSRIPVVVVSADATAASLERLRAAGADAYLTKPLDVDEFLRVVERFLPDAPTTIAR